METDQYQLVLTFDYENLNTPIQTIAEKLDAELTKVGLGKNSPKRIDVVAHSMGGLVVRHLIERIRKDHPLVKKFLLFGTPNGGSAFSNLSKVRDGAALMLLLAANGAKYLIPTIAPWLYGANGLIAGTKAISPTLEQLHPTSTFIKDFKHNNLQTATQYHVIAGNVQHYAAKGHPLYRLWEKVKTTSLGVVYREEASDLIVSTAQVFDMPDGENVKRYEIGGYHMNYFEGEGLKLLFDILENNANTSV